jgi:peptide chain release factor 3
MCYTARLQDATGAFEGDSVPVSAGWTIRNSRDCCRSTALARLRDEAELAKGGYAGFDEVKYRAGDLTPVYFGSALKDFGVEQLIDALADYAPPPRAQPAEPREVKPEETAVSGFIFKVQANMNPQHRDRIAFMRLCAGRFRRGMKLSQIGTGKTIAVHSPLLFMARDRELADEAYPGDIIGIPNHGTLRVGDTLTEGEELRFTGHAQFRAGNPAARAAGGPDQDQAAAQRAQRHGRGRDHAGLPSLDRVAVDRGRGGATAAGSANLAPAGRI